MRANEESGFKVTNVPVIGADGGPLDRIELRGIRATANHGVLAAERENPQEFRADIALYLDTQPAAEIDALAATVNYAAVAEAVGYVLTAPPVNLIETLAEQVAAAVLAFPSVQAVDVVLHKPQAPLAVQADDVTVSIRRDNVNRKPVAHVRVTAADLLAEVEAELPVVESGPAVEPEESISEPPVSIEPILAGPPVAIVQVPDGEPAEVEIWHDDAAESALDARLDAAPESAVPAILGLGSNMGDSIEILRGAVAALERASQISVMEVGPLARTSAVGGPAGQDDFFNTVVLVNTTLSPRSLLDTVHQIEAEFDRVRAEEWGPRTLDIDIVSYGDLVASDNELTIPHKLAHDRAFVLLPWSQMQPGATLPGPGGGPIGPLAATAPDREGVRWMRLDWLAPTPAPVPDEDLHLDEVDAVAAQYHGPQYEEPQHQEPQPELPPEPEWEPEPQHHPEPHWQSEPQWQSEPELPSEEPGTLIDVMAAGQAHAAGQPVPDPAPYVHHEASVGLWNVGLEPPAPQHPWNPTVPAPGPTEYPTFTGILHGAPGNNAGHPGGPAQSQPTFTGEVRAGSPLAARAQRVPLLQSGDLKVPEFDPPQRHNPATPVPPFNRPAPRPVMPPQPPEPEMEAPSWDQILRG